jgi:hypothetical protein
VSFSWALAVLRTSQTKPLIARLTDEKLRFAPFSSDRLIGSAMWLVIAVGNGTGGSSFPGWVFFVILFFIVVAIAVQWTRRGRGRR